MTALKRGRHRTRVLNRSAFQNTNALQLRSGSGRKLTCQSGGAGAAPELLESSQRVAAAGLAIQAVDAAGLEEGAGHRTQASAEANCERAA